jgi:hypothetical protein
MGGPAWNDDPDTPRLRTNLDSVAVEVFDHAQSGVRPDRDLPRRWHQRMLEGVEVPSDAYRGGYRGESHPDLRNYAVAVQGIPAVPPKDVSGQLTKLMTWLRNEIRALDRMNDVISRAEGDRKKRQLELDKEVVRVAAGLHGEWVRIHPFVNGNGRTARMWVLWVTSRYGLRPLLPLRPRPSAPYGDVARASLATGEHSTTTTYLLQLYSRTQHD